MQAQICKELSDGQAKFPTILSQNGQITLKNKINDPHFDTSPEYSQICDLLSCGQGKVDDRRTDAGNDNTPSAWKAKG